jgi:beta-lactamase regulating signal transducer with metallopeptidase domain
MNWDILINSRLIADLGWTLIYTIWQISLIAFVLFLILRICKNFSANARYLLAVAALGFAFVLPLATVVQLTNDLAQNQLAEKISTWESASSVKRREALPDNFPPSPSNNLEAADFSGGNSFFSLNSFQKNLNQTLSSFLPVIVLLWILGVGAFTFRLGGGVWQLHRYKTLEVSKPTKDWQQRFSALCEKLKIRQSVRILQSNLIKTPIVVGWLKPLILMPTSVFLQMNPRELEAILAHELAHIRRFDNLVNFVQSFIEILFFYHPCVWWMSAVIRREREFADDLLTRRIAVRVQNSPARVCCFLRENKLAAFAVEFRSPSDKFLNVFCAFADQYFDSFRIAQSRARNQSIFFVQFGVVIIRQNNRDAALRVFGI